MNKTININLGGVAFVIDELAYQDLNHYLTVIKEHFSKSEGSDEIMNDIEGRMAELFGQFQTSKKIIGIKEVKNVIIIMGTPEDFGVETNQYNHTNFTLGKRLLRNPDDKVLGGVCSGISSYFGIQDPLWLRIAFILAFFLFGSGLLLYFILLIILPKAENSADRLAMKGKPINVENIAKIVEDGVGTITNKMNDVKSEFSNDHSTHKLNDILANVGNFVVEIINRLALIVRPLLKLAGVFFLLLMLFCFLTMGLGMVLGFPLLDYFYGTDTLFKYFSISNTFLLLLFPIIGIIILILKIVFKNNASGKIVKTLGIFFFITILLSLLQIPYFIKSFARSITITSAIDLNNYNKDRLIINTKETNYNDDFFQMGDLNIKDDFLEIKSAVNIKFLTTTDSLISVEKSIFTRGKSEMEAGKLAKNIIYNYELKDNTLTLDNNILIPKGTMMRGQHVNIKIMVPIGKSVGINKETYNRTYFLKILDTEKLDNWEEDNEIRYFKADENNYFKVL